MPFGNKSRWSCAPFVESAAGYLEKPIARPALKMMVVFLARNLIERSQFGRIDPFQPPLLHKKLQIAIYGCLIQRAHRPAPGFQNFINAQRSIRFEKNLLNGIPLICFPLHSGSTASDIQKGPVSNPSLHRPLIQAPYCRSTCIRLDNHSRLWTMQTHLQ
jgi:hypothetical protein